MKASTAAWLTRASIGIGVVCVAFVGGALYGTLARQTAATPLAVAPAVVAQAAQPLRTQADFGSHTPAPDARRLADWVVSRNDTQGKAFMVVDKKNARLYVFGADGVLTGTTPVLLGQARGDHSVPGIGQRPLAQVRPFERTTPAGRFVTEPGRTVSGEDVVWIDYDAAVSMHRVRPTVAKERRLQRLASPSSADNRISFGCINLPTAFYDQVVSPVFSRMQGVAYVLPEVTPLEHVFAGFPSARSG